MMNDILKKVYSLLPIKRNKDTEPEKRDNSMPFYVNKDGSISINYTNEKVIAAFKANTEQLRRIDRLSKERKISASRELRNKA